MTDRKTNRKNRTNLVIKWPSNEDFFTVESLMAMNPDFIEITLRVRLKKATEENMVAEIGHKNCGKGRPIKAFAMKPVTQAAIDKATTEGITIESPSSVPVIQINADKPTVVQTPINIIGTPVAV